MKVSIKSLANLLDESESNVRHVLRTNHIKLSQLRNIFADRQAWKRRDEFYNLFESDQTADYWWECFMDNYYLEKYGIVLDTELK